MDPRVPRPSEHRALRYTEWSVAGWHHLFRPNLWFPKYQESRSAPSRVGGKRWSPWITPSDSFLPCCCLLSVFTATKPNSLSLSLFFSFPLCVGEGRPLQRRTHHKIRPFIHPHLRGPFQGAIPNFVFVFFFFLRNPHYHKLPTPLLWLRLCSDLLLPSDSNVALGVPVSPQ